MERRVCALLLTSLLWSLTCSWRPWGLWTADTSSSSSPWADHPLGALGFPQPCSVSGVCSAEHLQAQALTLLATNHLPAPRSSLGCRLSFLAAGRFSTRVMVPWMPMGSHALSDAAGISAPSISPPGPEGACPCPLWWSTSCPPILSNFPASGFPLAVGLPQESSILEHIMFQIWETSQPLLKLSCCLLFEALQVRQV